jgi:hypothetical protein
VRTLLWSLKSGESVLFYMNAAAFAEFASMSECEQDAYVESAPRVAGAIGL